MEFKDYVREDSCKYVMTLELEEFCNVFGKSTSTEAYDDKDMKVEVYYRLIKEYLKLHYDAGFTDGISNGIIRTYKASDKNPNGRLFVKEPMGLQRIHNILRSFLTYDIYYDYDISCCHPNIFFNLAKNNDDCENNLFNIETLLKDYKNIIEKAGTDKLTMLKKLNSDNARCPKLPKKCALISEYIKDLNICKNHIFLEQSVELPCNNNRNPISSYVNKLMCIEENKLLMKNIPDDDKNLVLMFDGFLSRKEIDIDNFDNSIYKWVNKPIINDIRIPDDWEFVLPIEREYVENDHEAAMKVLELYPHIVCCEGNLYIYNEENGMWNVDNNYLIFKGIIFKCESHLYKSTDKGTINYANSVSLINNICSIIKSLCVNNEWLDNININSGLYKLLFKNGIYDFKTKTFTKGFDPNVIFFNRINYDYPEDVDNDIYNKVKNEFFEKPFTKKQIENGVSTYLLERISKAIAGDFVKDFNFCLGKSNAGKSMLMRMLSLTFQKYVASYNGECMAGTSGEDNAKNYRWALDLRYTRLIGSSEIEMGLTLNGNKIKKATGHDEMVGRQHGGNETSFIPHFSMFLFANDLPKIKPIDDGTKNRCRVVSYEKKFGDTYIEDEQEVIDYKFEDKMKNPLWINAFCKLIIDNYKQDNVSVPNDVISDFDEYTEGDNFKEIFENDFIICNYKPNDDEYNNSFIVNQRFSEWRKDKNLHMSSKKFAMELQTLGATIGKKNGKRGFYNVKFNCDSEEDDTD
jgi:hypothetical protein